MKDVLNWAGEHPVLAILIVWAVCEAVVGVCAAVVGVAHALVSPFVAPAVSKAMKSEADNGDHP